MEWIYVVIAGLLEVLSINYMNKWQLVKHLGFKKSGILIIKMVLAFATSLLLLNLALKTLPMSITYAVWSGIGSVGGVLVGIIRYGESENWKRLVCIAMILSSVVGLKLVS
ncbi:MAG: SMR family transporter [Megamonas funiformis]|uniref:DMT family transporter n=1 Tax=Megamonas funiformis TaxID=437897 RepID=UPI002A8401EC|nr:SMR family transporter [Megamonas funiformis]MDY3874023.1 SMR family transporter [Megamonas funiformis]